MDKYIQAATEMAEELVEALTEPELQTLRDQLAVTAVSDWLRWLDEVTDEVESFVRATPAARRRSARWKPEFPFLVFAAYLHSRRARAMLIAVSRHHLSPGGPYRQLTARAGSAFSTAELEQEMLPEWPWEGDFLLSIE